MQKLTIISVWLFILAFSSIAFGNECIKCHQEKGVETSTPKPSPILMKAEGTTRSLSLADAFKQHGVSCPGVTTTYRAMQYGIKLLYGDKIPEQGDLVVFSRTPVPGSRDFLDLLLYEKKEYPKNSDTGGHAGRT